MLDLSITSLLYALSAAIIVSLVSLLGIIIIFKEESEGPFLLYLLSLSAGGMVGTAFFHLIPEALESNPNVLSVFIWTSVGFLIFFIVEKLLHLHHHHYGNYSHKRRLGYINLFSEGVHNFLDGIAIMAAFAAGYELGFVVTFAVIIHEIPQEIGDFGVLLYSGFSKKQAVFNNFMIALTALAGVLVGYFLLESSLTAEKYLIPFAAGSFLYISASSLIPEIHKEEGILESFFSFVVLVIALILMYFFKIYFE